MEYTSFTLNIMNISLHFISSSDNDVYFLKLTGGITNIVNLKTFYNENTLFYGTILLKQGSIMISDSVFM